jgi:hypothetical protein
MNIKIYQAYYREDQKEHLDQQFEPFDNTSNPVKNLYEHYIYHQVYKRALAEGVDRWGVFSWQWRKKLTYLNADAVLGMVDQTVDDCDVMIFNAYPGDELVAYNVWEQGAWSHPYIVVLGRKLLELMGENPDIVYLPMDRSTYCAANYFVGTAKFWEGLLEFLDRYVAAIDKLDDEHKKMLYSSAGYEPNPALDYTGFVCERLISTYLVKAQYHLRISAFIPGTHELGDLKHEAVRNQDKEKIKQWNELRPAKGIKLATEWIEKVF